MAEDTDGFGTIIKNGVGTETTLRNSADTVTETVRWNYQRMNSVGHPYPSTWPHGVATVEWVRLQSMQNRLVQIGTVGSSVSLDAVTPWQGAAAIDNTDTSAFDLPLSPTQGDIVDVYVARGGPCAAVFAGDAGGSINDWGSIYPVGSNNIVRFTCTGAGPAWTTETRTIAQWNDAVNSAAVGLAIQAGGLATQAVQAVSSSRTVIWRPFEEPGSGYVTSWADAVAAVNLVSGPTVIQIEAPVNGDAVIIPGGVWELNQTTIVGQSVNSDMDTSYRGITELLYVVTEGDAANPTWIKGCTGLKDMFFRASDYNASAVNGSGGRVESVDGSSVQFIAGGGVYTFTASDVGKPIRIGSITPYSSFGLDVSAEGNRGTFIITAVINGNTIVYTNNSGSADEASNGDIGWSLCTSPFILAGASDDSRTSFILDNADFRYGGDYNWGTIYVDGASNLFMHQNNGASIRWFSCIVDGYMVIQSDGGGSWVGTAAFAGLGHVDVFPMAGTQVRPWQPSILSWTLHEPYTIYLPADAEDWDATPESVHDALNYLADTRLRKSQNLGDLDDTATARTNLGLGTAATADTSSFHTVAGFTRIAPTDPGATAAISASTSPAMLVDGSGCSAGTITSVLDDGAFDGQEVTLIAGPWGGGVVWDVTPTHGAFQSGNTLRFAGLAGAVTLKWWLFGATWFIISQRGLVSIV